MADGYFSTVVDAWRRAGRSFRAWRDGTHGQLKEKIVQRLVKEGKWEELNAFGERAFRDRKVHDQTSWDPSCPWGRFMRDLGSEAYESVKSGKVDVFDAIVKMPIIQRREDIYIDGLDDTLRVMRRQFTRNLDERNEFAVGLAAHVAYGLVKPEVLRRVVDYAAGQDWLRAPTIEALTYYMRTDFINRHAGYYKEEPFATEYRYALGTLGITDNVRNQIRAQAYYQRSWELERMMSILGHFSELKFIVETTDPNDEAAAASVEPTRMPHKPREDFGRFVPLAL